MNEIINVINVAFSRIVEALPRVVAGVVAVVVVVVG